MPQGEAQTEEEALASLCEMRLVGGGIGHHGNVDWALLSCKKWISWAKTDRLSRPPKVPPQREIRDIQDDYSSEEEQGGSTVGIYIDGLPEVLAASSISAYLSLAAGLTVLRMNQSV